MTQSAVPTRPATSAGGTLALALLRTAIGWHFLYEGMIKLLDPDWTAAEYLRNSTGPLASRFQALLVSPTWLRVVDQLNIWGLILVGLCLMLGLLTRLGALVGMVMLALYYLAYPPFFGAAPAGMAEGHYLIVSKNLVELLALLVVLALPASGLGLDGVLSARRQRRLAAQLAAGQAPAPVVNLVDTSRRRMVAGLVGLPVVGGFVLAMLKQRGWTSHEENNLAVRPDAYSGATIKKFDFSKTVKDVKGVMPQGKIGNVVLSRMCLGGNLIGGWAHARDLIYVSKLIKAYHHRAKVFETFRLAEACGVNTIITNPALCGIISDYWKSTGGKMQFISDCGGTNLLEGAQRSIDTGAVAAYVHGGMADELVAKGDFDPIVKTLELIRRNGLPAGIAGHKLRTVQACVEKGIEVDFWMKTLHRPNYWSAKPAEECDNIWCDQPENTVAFMAAQKKPWIAYKILAAGAIEPQNAFRYAFESGADFICVGMYDFQIVEDVNHALDALAARLERQRAWYA
jgi:uncharacterized membrane protein YphA (DoxX/SURF4 family)